VRLLAVCRARGTVCLVRPRPQVSLTQPHNRRARGFTLLETVAALAVSFILLVALVAWVASLMRSTTYAVDLAGTSRDARQVASRLDDDLVKMAPCGDSGLVSVWIATTPDSVAFYADVVDSSGVAGQDGLADVVTWGVSLGSLRRGVAPGSGGCGELTDVALYVNVSDSVEHTASTQFFELYKDGAVQQYEPSCTVMAVRCRFDAVRIQLQVTENSVDGSPSKLDETYEVSLDTQRV
jgi:type II secretory pathway component PulJ